MPRRKSSSVKHRKVPIVWFILAIIALAIPLTVLFSQQRTNLRQDAAKKKNVAIKLSVGSRCGKKNADQYRKANYVCANGISGQLTSSCHKKSYYMQQAQALCQKAVINPTVIPTVPQPTYHNDPPCAFEPEGCQPSPTYIIDPPCAFTPEGCFPSEEGS